MSEITELEQFKKLLKESGVVGAGGAGFPTYAKLSDKADTVIMNCAECEPLLRLHRQLLEVHTSQILSAFDTILSATGAQRGIIAVKEHYRETLKAVEYELEEHPKLSLRRLGAVYPSGDELLLIKEATGRGVQPGELPISVGVIVCNVETVYNVGRALAGEPVTDKFVTVAGEVKAPVTLKVPIGTEINEIIKAAGGVTTDRPAYISGGPMMGRLISPKSPVTKTTNAVIVLPEDHPVIMNKMRNPKISLRRAMSVCCQCRSCTELCSRHAAGYPVEPHMVMRVLSNGGKGDVLSLAGSMFCSGCGLCETYSCPQGLSPRALIDEIKAAARMNGIKPPTGMKLSEVKDAEYKKVSVERLTSRLALKKYDVPAPLTLSEQPFETHKVRIMLSQHIGSPAEPVVKQGDRVTRGDAVAVCGGKTLGVYIHASIDGTVSEVCDKYIVIEKKAAAHKGGKEQ